MQMLFYEPETTATIKILSCIALKETSCLLRDFYTLYQYSAPLI